MDQLQATFINLFYLISRNHWTTTTHMRAIDVWVVLCYIGIFSSLMEYCGILYLTEDSESKNGNYKKEVECAILQYFSLSKENLKNPEKFSRDNTEA